MSWTQSAEDRLLDPLIDLVIEALSVTSNVILQYVMHGDHHFTQHQWQKKAVSHVCLLDQNYSTWHFAGWSMRALLSSLLAVSG